MTTQQPPDAVDRGPDAAKLREELLRRRLSRSGSRSGTGIPRVDRGGPLALSSGQRQFWFLQSIDPEATEYLVPMAYRLRGSLREDALREAWERLTERHEILRTRYLLDGAEPRQVVDPPGGARFRLVDRAGTAPEHLADEVVRGLERAGAEAFVLDQEPPARVELVRLGAQDHLLVIVLHHIVCDAATRVLLLRELSELYAARTEDRLHTLPADPVQFADYAAWRNARDEGSGVRDDLAWWQEHLAGLAPLDLPTDRPRGAVRSWRGDTAKFSVPQAIADRLRTLAERQGASLFMVGLTAYQALLSRHSGARDIAVGTAVSGRSRSELATMAGYAFNTVVMRASWEGAPSFHELLAANRETVLASLDRSAVPFDRLADALEPVRDPSTTPVYQVMFDLAGGTGDELLRLPGVEAEPVEVPQKVARFDLTMHLEQRTDGGLDGSLEYSTALFDAATANRLTGHYLRLLEAVTAAPEAPVASLDIFAPEEHALLLDGSREPLGVREALDPAALRPVHEAIAGRAAAVPDAVAVYHGERELTYGELGSMGCRFGHLLRTLGTGPERTVGVLLDNAPETVAALLGIWWAGGAQLALDPRYPDERLAYMIADTGTQVVVTERRYAERLAGTGVHLVIVDGPDGQEALAGSPDTPLAPPSGGYDLDHLAYVIYTSGSTGRPKGVLIGHRGLANYLGWTAEVYGGAGEGGAPFFSSIAFDLGVPDLYTPLMTGHPLHLLDQDSDVGELGARLARRAPYAFVKLTPGQLNLLAEQLTDEQAAEFAGLVIPAGDTFTTRLARRWRQKAGPAGTRLAAEYGPTEITVGNSAYFVTGDEETELVSIGRAIPHTAMRVLDAELWPVPIGGVGEVCVSGIGLARGYLGRPGLTAERFVPDPYGPAGSRLYRTGDLARVLPDGNLDFVSRIDHQVKLRGHRIETGEVESALTAYQGVAEAVVLVREDTPGDKSLVAYFVPDPGATEDLLEPELLRGHVATSLPDYMIPAAFVRLTGFPLTGNGKLDRRALPAPGRDATTVGEHVAPRTDAERAMAAAWGGVLGIEAIGVYDNFFDLGGDSLRAVALAGALQADGIPVAVRDLFENPTVAALCRGLARGEGAGTERFTPVEPTALLSAEDRAALPQDAVDAYPLSRTQAGMFVEMYSGDGENRYHNITTFRVRDEVPFDPDAFQAAADQVVARHEVMRTSFAFSGFSQPLQIVHATGTMPCVHEDLRGLSREQRWPSVTEFADRDREQLFDPSRAPLMRMATHVLDDEGWWLSITEGHPAIEGWSYHNQLMELLHAYQHIRDGAEPEPAPPAPPVRYADFVAAELRSLDDPEDQAYWRALINARPKFRVPQGWAGDPEMQAERYRLDIPLQDLEPGLRALASATGTSYKSVLHAAHSKVLSLLTRQQEFRGGMVIDARPEAPGADRVSGMYLNSVPFPYERSARTWGELVLQVYRVETGMWQHRRFPMPAMRHPGGERHLVEVLFHYLDFHQVDAALIDNAATRDISPNEFPLVVGTPTPGLLSIASDTRTLRRSCAERLARLYEAVLTDMAATGSEGDARRAYPEKKEFSPEVPGLSGQPRPLDALAAFEERARSNGAALAVTAGSTHLTYGELDARANRLAHRLRALGAGPEHRVGVLLNRGPALVAALLAVWKTGAAYVSFDPCIPDARLRAQSGTTGCRLVVTETAYRERVAGLVPLVVDAPEEAALLSAQPDVPPQRPAHPDRLAYVLHTSGSTGRPKGVEVSHRALGHYLDWAVRTYLADSTGDLTPASGAAGPSGGAPFFTSVGADLGVPALYGPLLTGRTVHVLPQRWEPESFGDLLSAGAPYDFVGLTPGHLALLEQQLDDRQLAGLAPLLVSAGDALPGGQADRIAVRTVAGGGAQRLVAEYGPTEAAVAASAHRVEGPALHDLVPMGGALPGTTLRLLDENLEPVPDGVVGEVAIAGPQLARGYAGEPGKTAERFVPDPYGRPGDRLYRTGDLARVLPSGALEFAGRVDRQVKVRGHRVDPAETEAALLADPWVSAALVVPLTHPEGEITLAAWVVPSDAAGAPLSAAALRERLREVLPEPLMPATYRIVAALPLTENGKYDRETTADAAEREAAPVTVAYAPARTETERRLAEVWQQVLGVRQVGVHDDFRDLGGDSLLALAVLSRARAAGLSVELTVLLSHSTVAALAAALDETANEG